MKPRYVLKSKPSEACCDKDINPWLLVVLVIALSIAAGFSGASLAKL